MSSLDLPASDVRTVEIDADSEELLRRAARDELAPVGEYALRRYVLYLGAAYTEAERVLGEASTPQDGYERLSRAYGASSGRAAVLRFHYSEQSRGHADEARARAAHERQAGAYHGLVERIQDELGVREQRIANLRKALGR